MKSILITGANRGIGLGLVTAYLERGERIFATFRHPSSIDNLNMLKNRHDNRLHLIQVEVTDMDSVETSVEVIQQYTDSLDLLINNAAILLQEDNFSQVTADNLRQTYEVNVIAPMAIIMQYLPLIKRGITPIVVNISSSGGSITSRTGHSLYSYASSKAALNMLTKMLSTELRSDGVTVIPLHPGWVHTRMGTNAAPLSVEESVAGMIHVIDNLTIADTGRFLQWDGQELSW